LGCAWHLPAIDLRDLGGSGTPAPSSPHPSGHRLRRPGAAAPSPCAALRRSVDLTSARSTVRPQEVFWRTTRLCAPLAHPLPQWTVSCSWFCNAAQVFASDGRQLIICRQSCTMVLLPLRHPRVGSGVPTGAAEVCSDGLLYRLRRYRDWQWYRPASGSSSAEGERVATSPADRCEGLCWQPAGFAHEVAGLPVTGDCPV
jgi:hypothetical protein